MCFVNHQRRSLMQYFGLHHDIYNFSAEEKSQQCTHYSNLLIHAVIPYALIIGLFEALLAI